MAWQDEALPENVREWEEAKNSETREKFFEQIGNMRSMIGRSIRIPGEDASPEDKKGFIDKVIAKAGDTLVKRPQTDEEVIAFYRQMGMPEKDEGYVDPKFTDLPEGVGVDAERLKAFKAMAHKRGLTQKQFEGLVADFIGPDLAAKGEGLKAEKVAAAELKAEWGDLYDRKVAQAELVRKEHFPFIPENGMDSRTVKALATLAGKIGVEGQGLRDDEQRGTGVMTRDEAKLRIAEITNNKDHPYWKASDMGHEAARRRMRELNIIAYN